MKLYHCPQTRAFRALWLLEESGLDFDVLPVDIRDEASRADPEFRSASPMGKVPALIDGDTKLWDSGAIALHLVDSYPQAGLGPAVGEPGRGTFIQWVMFTNAVFEPALMEKFTNAAVDSSRSGHGSFPQMIEIVENGLQPGPWLMGERFTAADVLVGSSCHFMKLFGAMPDSPPIAAYIERCQSRPAFAAAQAVEVPASAGDE